MEKQRRVRTAHLADGPSDGHGGDEEKNRCGEEKESSSWNAN